MLKKTRFKKSSLIIIGGITLMSAITYISIISFRMTKNNSMPSVYVIGDSIPFGHKDCNSKGCGFEPQTFLYLYTKSKYPNGTKYQNLAYSGTTAGCSFDSCPDSDQPDNNSGYKNSFINPVSFLPNDQHLLETADNLTYHPAAGKARALIGEFDTIRNSEVIIAYGRNDVNTKTITLEQFKSGLAVIIDRLQNHNNLITLMTIPPMTKEGWKLYVPEEKRRSEFNDKIKNIDYPVELDTFFSSVIWELAYRNNTDIVPIHEYLYFHQDPDYFSSDFIHPGSSGHHLIFNLLREKSRVYKTDLSYLPHNSEILVKSTNKGYGQIVFTKADQFYASQPLEFIPGQPLKILLITGSTVIYSTFPIEISVNTLK